MNIGIGIEGGVMEVVDIGLITITIFLRDLHLMVVHRIILQARLGLINPTVSGIDSYGFQKTKKTLESNTNFKLRKLEKM